MSRAVDVGRRPLPHLLPLLAQLGTGVAVHPIFLDATTAALVRRFSERAAPTRSPIAARWSGVELERGCSPACARLSTVLDTSQLRPTQLRS